jgi:aspartyl protease family protein
MTDPAGIPPPPPSPAPARPPRRRRFGRLVLGLVAAAVLFFVVRNNVPETFGLSSGDVPRLIVLVGILVLVSAGLFGRGMRVGEVIRGITTWALILVVLVGIYATRDQLAGLAGRVLGAIAPGVPISGRLSGETNPDSVAVVRSADGHFGVLGMVDGKSVEFLVDTGASFVTLTNEVAARLGVDTSALRYDVPIHTANGATTAAGTTLGRIAIGPIERRNVRALVAPPGALDLSLLGMTFLDTLRGYAVSGDRLVLTP